MKNLTLFVCSLWLFSIGFLPHALALSNLTHTLSTQDKHIATIIKHTKDKSFSKAHILAQKVNNRTLDTLLEWAEIQNSNQTRYQRHEIQKFINEHANWPNINTIERALEYQFTYKTPAEEIIQFFTVHPPKTSHGKSLFAQTKLRLSPSDISGITLLRESWPYLSLSTQEQARVIKEYGRYLRTEDYEARAEQLLWNIQITLAKQLFSYISTSKKALYEARIALIQNKRGIDRKIEALSASQQQDPAFIYNRSRWHQERKNYIRMYDIMKDLTTAVSHPEQWWKMRRFLIRELIERQHYAKAYHIAKHHGTTPGSAAFAEAQWLAGWLSLRFLKQPNTAYNHFGIMYQNVRFPISKSRASYWAGRAASASGIKESAQNWYRISSAYPYTFYSQLALEELHGTLHITIPKFPNVTRATRKKMQTSSVVQAAILLMKSGEDKWSKLFLEQAVKNTDTPEELAYLAELGIELNMPHLSVETSNAISRIHNLFFAKTAFPILDKIEQETNHLALTHAIIRQESRFNTYARSSANARGLMQLLPSTAKRTARQLHTRYHTLKLTRDPKFNIRVGSHYIEKTRERFDGSYILGTAAYNAGPTNVRRWLRTYGTPIESNLYNTIDWIELIPFFETRNYVQRVLENLQVYHTLLTPKRHISLTDTLTYRQTP